MFDENSLSLDAFSDDAWLFLLEVPYFDLTGAQRVYVRHVLQSVYALEVVERIAAVAERNNLSAIDSAEVIRARTGDQTLFILPRRTVTEEKPQRQVRHAAPKQVKEIRFAYAVTGNESMHASVEQFHIFANHSAESIVSSHAQEMFFITNTPSRSARNPT